MYLGPLSYSSRRAPSFSNQEFSLPFSLLFTIALFPFRRPSGGTFVHTTPAVSLTFLFSVDSSPSSLGDDPSFPFLSLSPPLGRHFYTRSRCPLPYFFLPTTDTPGAYSFSLLTNSCHVWLHMHSLSSFNASTARVEMTKQI